MLNYDRVVDLLDSEAADLLAAHGLIARDAPYKPEYWRLEVRVGSQRPVWRAGMITEIEEIVHTHGLNGGPYWGWGRKPRTSFVKVYERPGPARKQLAIATAAGLNARLTPCVLMPVSVTP